MRREGRAPPYAPQHMDPQTGTQPSDTGTASLAGNARIAAMLREMASLLDAQAAEPYRSAAFRRAGDTVAALGEDVQDLLARHGLDGLDALPGIGPGIAAAIAEIATTGQWQRLEHARGDSDPESLLQQIPGVGPELARELHESLGAETLEAVEAAALDGRLERLPKIGPRRAAALRAAVSNLLDRRRQPLYPRAAASAPQPPVALLLHIDREYRRRAAAGQLPTLAPRRFNPSGEAWLPVLHATREGWRVTALFSNTARAHALGHVHDWVVIYADDGVHGQHQYTVVTPGGGLWAGRRVVRGREIEGQAPP